MGISTGIIFGTPTVARVQTFTVKAVDAYNGPSTKAFTITVNNAPLTIITSTLATGYVTAPYVYKQTLEARGGVPPYSGWTIANGILPPGLALNSSTGVISGTPVTAGNYPFTIQIKDSANISVGKSFNISIALASMVRAVTPINNATNVAPATVSATFSGDMSPATISGGSFTVRRSSNVTRIAAGSSHTVALRDDGTVVAWGSNNAGQTLVPAALAGVVGVAAGGSHTVALKEDGTVVAWGYNERGQTNIPDGLGGVIAIAAGGNHSVALKNDGSVIAWGYNEYGQTTVPAGLTGVTAISAGGAHTVALKRDGTVTGWGDNDCGQATMPSSPYETHLPGTVTWNPASFTATFTPDTMLPADSVIKASLSPGIRNLAGERLPSNASWSFSTAPAVFTIVTTSLPDGYAGSAYSKSLTTKDGKAPYAWSISGGSLPAGLSLDAATGAITGTPAAAGNSSFSVAVRDANNKTASEPLTIAVYAAPSIAVTTLPAGFAGSDYSQAVATTGGKGPYSWSVTSGSLPAGLTLDSINGSISGTPVTSGTGDFTIQLSDAGNVTVSKALAITVNPFVLRNLGDSGNVAVFELTGNFDAKNPDGGINVQPRMAIAKEYIRSHADTFDFVVFLSTFDYALPESGAEGFYLTVKNDVQGINQPIFDNSAQFGSASKLQGTIDLGNVSQLAATPYGPKLDKNVTTLNHELMHRFGAYVRFKNPDGTLNTTLLGKDSAHWSYPLDSQGSIMYGNGWKNNGDGTFTSTSVTSGYSPLDLYLMGMIPKEQVPPMLLIDNPAIDKTRLPQLGVTITGAAKTVTIDDIITAEGARVPDSTTSQKKFNVGFVLLTRAGDNTTAAAQAIEILRKAWAGKFAELTNNIGGVNGVTPSLTVTIDSPPDNATITGPDVSVTASIINSSGAETGVTVNGIAATVTGSRFIVNHVPLQLGANTITVTAMDVNGLTATATRSVTDQTGHYIRIVPNTDSGTAPLKISIHLDAVPVSKTRVPVLSTIFTIQQ